MRETKSQKNNLPIATQVKRETLQKARIELKSLPAALPTVNESAPKQEPVLEKSVVGVAVEETADACQKAQPERKVQPERTALKRTPVFVQPEVEAGSSINRKALESTNRGVSPKSRRFVRGILHPSPSKVIFAAFFAIAFRVALVGLVILMTLIVLEVVDSGLWWWALIFPVAALGHLLTAGQARCRVCGQREFVQSGARKHNKTHRLLFLGPIISTGLHVIIFKWFHCMFCGTAVRIKK